MSAPEPDATSAMLGVADNLDYYASKTTGGTHASGLEDAAAQIRAALAGHHTAWHRPLGGGLCVCGQPIHTTDEEADRG